MNGGPNQRDKTYLGDVMCLGWDISIFTTVKMSIILVRFPYRPTFKQRNLKEFVDCSGMVIMN